MTDNEIKRKEIYTKLKDELMKLVPYMSFLSQQEIETLLRDHAKPRLENIPAEKRAAELHDLIRKQTQILHSLNDFRNAYELLVQWIDLM